MGRIVAPLATARSVTIFCDGRRICKTLYTMVTICSSRSNSKAVLSWIEHFEDDGRVMNAQDTSAETRPDLPLEIAHLLLIDVVGYSKLLVNEQIEFLEELNQIVRSTECFRAAETTGKLIRVPTGDGMALLFLHSPEEPVRCALEISRTLKDHPHIQVRMGVHSGPVNQVTDVNDRTNIAGAGINIAQRVMDCGDAGHILLSKHLADDLAEYRHWRPHLHDLGECEVKYGLRLHLVNLQSLRLVGQNLCCQSRCSGRQPRWASVF
ncbi:MAG: hypothetical protein DME98_13525 [Verrucomicrobia bacterium]|nr:MAG: hypothetical protein DME98_13525 [Verrucomicrobiota bacterium]